MDLDPIIKQISIEAGLGENVTPHKSNIQRNLAIVLEEMDSMVNWRCSVMDFSKTVAANSNKALVSNVNLFKPIICRFVDSDSKEHPLTYRELTDYWIEDAKFGTDTNDSPTLYTIAGGYIYVGPGVMSASTSITGQVRRRLTENDVNELPAPMLVDGTVKRMTKAGSPENIRAWNGWNNSVRSIVEASKKHTGEERDVQPLDPVIARNIAYIKSL